ncbi:MAG: (deoxy)nucleoside triphosphate pyrophosphohydrolase [Candidatus Marinimicrobia bacterium]|nr:(deoxy)nucleoside triphosphate pyrophosphohydrolase [Candidatus Neomarinimicrobiota bacterium]
MLQVVAGIIELDGFILLCQRHRDSRRFPLKWEFPGGKVETGESPIDAIKRELEEELGIQVVDPEKLDAYSFGYPGEEDFHLHIFKIHTYENTIQNRQFETMSWVRPEEILNFDMLEGDLPFVKKMHWE